MRKLKLLFSFALVICLFSCQSTPKNITYYQDLEEVKNLRAEAEKYEPIIKSNDILLITVSSSTPIQEQVAQFNMPVNTYLVPGEASYFQSAGIQTYRVDENGDITYPIIGKVNLGGLKRSEAIALMEEKISGSVDAPMVNLSIVSYKVTVLGEVNRPGTVKAQDERITIFDALGAVGDMSIFGDRTNVSVIRDNGGELVVGKLDLTKAEVFSSPFYYLQQNDLVYVEPNDTKKRASKFGSAESYNLSMYSTVMSTISILSSAALAIVTIMKK